MLKTLFKDIKKLIQLTLETLKKLKPSYDIALIYFPKRSRQKARRIIKNGNSITKLNSEIIL